MNPEADATTRAPRATRRSRVAAVGARLRRAAPETLVFAGATTLLLLHALDDALLHREAGVPAGRHAMAAAIALAAAVAAGVQVPRLRPGPARRPPPPPPRAGRRAPAARGRRPRRPARDGRGDRAGRRGRGGRRVPAPAAGACAPPSPFSSARSGPSTARCTCSTWSARVRRRATR